MRSLGVCKSNLQEVRTRVKRSVVCISGVSLCSDLFTGKKENKIFLIYKEIQNRAVAKSFMRKGSLIYEKMRKYLTIYEEAVSHI
jgi:hypothetical protein